jgi:hypothetical protein
MALRRQTTPTIRFGSISMLQPSLRPAVRFRLARSIDFATSLKTKTESARTDRNCWVNALLRRLSGVLPCSRP